MLKSHDIAPINQALAGFVATCPEHITTYDLGGSTSNSRGIIDRIMASPPRLIVAIGPLAAQVAKAEVRGVPVVFAMVRNPRKSGLEGDNIAGISLDVPIEAQLAMYKALLPTLRVIGVIYDPEKTGTLVKEAGDVAENSACASSLSPWPHKQRCRQPCAASWARSMRSGCSPTIPS